MSKKKTKKKAARKASKPVDRAEAQLQAEVAEVRSLVITTDDGEDVPAVCFEHGCHKAAVEWVGESAYCQVHVLNESMYSAPHVVTEPATDEEIATSDNRVIREAFEKSKARAPYVRPPLADPPVLPDLTGRVLEFHTPQNRRGMYCDVAFALLLDEGVVVMRVHDRLAGETTYQLAGVGDMDEHQRGEIASRAWYRATDEQHAAIAACDPEPVPEKMEGAA